MLLAAPPTASAASDEERLRRLVEQGKLDAAWKLCEKREAKGKLVSEGLFDPCSSIAFELLLREQDGRPSALDYDEFRDRWAGSAAEAEALEHQAGRLLEVAGSNTKFLRRIVRDFPATEAARTAQDLVWKADYAEAEADGGSAAWARFNERSPEYPDRANSMARWRIAALAEAARGELAGLVAFVAAEPEDVAAADQLGAGVAAAIEVVVRPGLADGWSLPPPEGALEVPRIPPFASRLEVTISGQLGQAEVSLVTLEGDSSPPSVSWSSRSSEGWSASFDGPPCRDTEPDQLFGVVVSVGGFDVARSFRLAPCSTPLALALRGDGFVTIWTPGMKEADRVEADPSLAWLDDHVEWPRRDSGTWRQRPGMQAEAAVGSVQPAAIALAKLWVPVPRDPSRMGLSPRADGGGFEFRSSVDGSAHAVAPARPLEFAWLPWQPSGEGAEASEAWWEDPALQDWEKRDAVLRGQGWRFSKDFLDDVRPSNVPPNGATEMTVWAPSDDVLDQWRTAIESLLGREAPPIWAAEVDLDQDGALDGLYCMEWDGRQCAIVHRRGEEFTFVVDYPTFDIGYQDEVLPKVFRRGDGIYVMAAGFESPGPDHFVYFLRVLRWTGTGFVVSQLYEGWI